jgi:hypothetical protein
MARKKGSSSSIHVFLDSDSYQLLKAECARLSVNPGKFLSKLVLERCPTFHSHPIQLVDKK